MVVLIFLSDPFWSASSTVTANRIDFAVRAHGHGKLVPLMNHVWEARPFTFLKVQTIELSKDAPAVASTKEDFTLFFPHT